MTIAKTITEHMSDRDIMLFLGSVRGWRKDAEAFRDAADLISDIDACKVLRERIDDVFEEIEGTEEEITDIYHALDINVDDLAYYPVLFFGEVNKYEWINLSDIDTPSLPLNENGFKTAQLVRGRVPVPPICVSKFANGRYKVVDGRHRFLAFKLNGLEKIPAYVHPSIKEAIEATGNKYNKTFEKLAKGPEDE